MESDMKRTILVATAGQGILRSSDDGLSWNRLGLSEDIEFDGVVRCLAAHPTEPNVVFAGADVGLCKSVDGGASWRRIDSPISGMTVWSLAIDPRDARHMLAATGAPSRAAVFRSIDGGSTWERLPPEIPEFCQGVHRPRVLTCAIDPSDSRKLWFGVEEGGLWRSRDSGATWERVDRDAEHGASGVAPSDIHSIAFLRGPPQSILIVVVNGIFVSHDDGKSWVGRHAQQTWGLRYARCVCVRPGTNEAYLAIGDGTPGMTSKILRSTDLGESWHEVTLTQSPNSTFWAFGSHEQDPNLMFVGSKYGHLFRSRDAGNTWIKEWRDFSEITDVLWVPFKAADNLSAHR
jgi:photosystem II stability/assembly factor-like uncharacterized protein